jgi:H+-transporting ATPase
MRNITAAAAALGLIKLAFSTAVLVFGKLELGLRAPEMQTVAFLTLVFGNQALLYVVRERRHIWSSWPARWVLASSAFGIIMVSTLALTGTLMEILPWRLVASILVAATAFGLILDQIKKPIMSVLRAA